MWISIVRGYVGLVVVLERLQYVLLSVEFAVIVMIYAIYGYSILCGQTSHLLAPRRQLR